MTYNVHAFAGNKGKCTFNHDIRQTRWTLDEHRKGGLHRKYTDKDTDKDKNTGINKLFQTNTFQRGDNKLFILSVSRWQTRKANTANVNGAVINLVDRTSRFYHENIYQSCSTPASLKAADVYC
jgi:hypothetical protein